MSFQIFGSKLVIFDFDDRMLFWKIIRFFENIKNLFCRSKLKTYDIVGGTRTWCNIRMDGCLRLRTYIVSTGSRPKQPTGRRPSLLMDGMDWREYQKFLIRGYIEHAYIYFYRDLKIITNILVSFKIWYHVRWGKTILETTLFTWVFKYLVPNLFGLDDR